MSLTKRLKLFLYFCFSRRQAIDPERESEREKKFILFSWFAARGGRFYGE